MSDLLKIIGNVHRPTLGEEIPLSVFRAFRLYSGMYLKELMGNRGAVVLFQNAGRELGKAVGKTVPRADLKSYLEEIEAFVKDSKIGLLLPERVEEEVAVFRLEECITCSGMPNIGERICHFEVGFVAGVLENFLKRRVKAYETKCNAMGEGVCEVKLELKDAQNN
ncbi:MAG: 4-vinyl reductase [Aquificae bacterium]|nr:4-vinyl reductase [Aquificota bacterium]